MGYFFTQWTRLNKHMLARYFKKGAMEGTTARQPFIHNDA